MGEQTQRGAWAVTSTPLSNHGHSRTGPPHSALCSRLILGKCCGFSGTPFLTSAAGPSSTTNHEMHILPHLSLVPTLRVGTLTAPTGKSPTRASRHQAAARARTRYPLSTWEVWAEATPCEAQQQTAGRCHWLGREFPGQRGHITHRRAGTDV